MEPPKVVFVVGPTAVGKTMVACSLAQKLGGEIVSCDAMQIYREVPVTTSQPDKNLLEVVPHHLFGFLSVEESFDVATYNRLASTKIQEIVAKGKRAVVTGGSGLYMQVLLDGIFPGPQRNEELRQSLIQRIEQEGPEILYHELCHQDPVAALGIHPNDHKRLIRALEVCAVTKARFSDVKKNRKGLWGRWPMALYVLTRERAQLYSLIDKRVDEMFTKGIVGEIQGLATKSLSLTAQSIIGVKEIRGYLDGDYDVAKAKDMLKQNTRRYAKRQLTWFRKEKRLKGLVISPEETSVDLAERIVRDWGGT